MIYIAAPFFNDEQLFDVQSIEAALEQRGFKYFSPRKHTFTIKNLPEEAREAAAPKVFESNVDGLNHSTLVIACIDHKDIGTAWEMGYVFRNFEPLGLNNLLTISMTGKASNVMLSQCSRGHFLGLNEFVKFLAAAYEYAPLTIREEEELNYDLWDDVIEHFNFKKDKPESEE